MEGDVSIRFPDFTFGFSCQDKEKHRWILLLTREQITEFYHRAYRECRDSGLWNTKESANPTHDDLLFVIEKLLRNGRRGSLSLAMEIRSAA